MLFKLSHLLGCMRRATRGLLILGAGGTIFAYFLCFHEIRAMSLYGSDDNNIQCLRSKIAGWGKSK